MRNFGFHLWNCTTRLGNSCSYSSLIHICVVHIRKRLQKMMPNLQAFIPQSSYSLSQNSEIVRSWTNMRIQVTSDSRYFVVKIKWHCDFIIDFWANSYFIFQMHHAKIFKMRYIKSLYKPFWKYESWFCSEVSKTHFTKYPWNHAYAGMKKNILSNNIS